VQSDAARVGDDDGVLGHRARRHCPKRPVASAGLCLNVAGSNATAGRSVLDAKARHRRPSNANAAHAPSPAVSGGDAESVDGGALALRHVAAVLTMLERSLTSSRIERQRSTG
jgi:hypothetical protein